MTTITKFGKVMVDRVNGKRDHSSMFGDIEALQIGDSFHATFNHKHSARLARHSLSHYARYKLKFKVEAHQRGAVLEIKRTA